MYIKRSFLCIKDAMYHVYTLLLQLILFILTNITTNNKNNFASYNTKIKIKCKAKMLFKLRTTNIGVR